MQSATPPNPIDSSKPYEILPNGKKRYTRATAVDIVLSVILPFWGLVLGGIALARGEAKRGKTMMLIGAIFLAVVVITRFLPA